ncbi:hypothetical protein FJZ36_00165 [Candidatus Poribacteria bacterium]|nr:hypothetical protein [Candidatus Poribacteria bacterium]
MEFFGLVFPFIVALVLINRVFDYQKAKVLSRTQDRDAQQLAGLREDIGRLQEMVADVLLELDEQRRLRSTGSAPPLPPSSRAEQERNHS